MIKKIQVTCRSEFDTRMVGQKLGEILKPRDLVEITGDIGAGKTTFVRGMADGIKSDRPATSPTFNILQTYRGRIKLHHMDLFRLDEPGLIDHQIKEALEEPDAAVVIEWSDIVEYVLPRKRYKIKIVTNPDESRRIIIDPPSGDPK
ncbi:tRNA (adenosine(37)-N6)-threonylcarbamoyltransferase complex ATPase subunit type 1 TsaE [Candidatus Parcubacteria bacterium]|nr:tRNA (adenosine(37)-N6)-threonylcarbamoyltransferase complex ATPase subunit type 1 TsaE [Candidatus Parcubacteria bacterium]